MNRQRSESAAVQEQDLQFVGGTGFEQLLDWSQRADPSGCVVQMRGVEDDLELHCTAVLRWLPEKRLVCAASMNGRPVLVKWYLGASAHRHQRREWRGAGLLADAGVATPALLHVWCCAAESESHSEVYALVYEFIEGAVPLDDSALMGERALFPELWALLASLNAAGLTHGDLHFGNLLRVDRSLWLIDPDAVTGVVGQSLAQAASVEQFLGVAVQTRRSLSLHELRSHWQTYASARRDALAEPVPAALQRKYRSARRRRVLDFLSKTQRNCSAFAHRRTLTGEALLDRGWLAAQGDENVVGREMLAWLDALPELMDGRDAERQRLLKRGNTATVVAAQFRGQPLIVKRYNNKSALHRLRRFVRPDRGLNSWTFAHALGFVGIATAPAVALLRTRFAGPTFLVMRVIEGDEVNPEYFNRAEHGEEFERLSLELVTLMEQLAAEGYVHRDTKASNFLWDARRDQLALIDLDSMTMPRSRRAARRGHDRDRRRLLRNFAASPELQRRLGSRLGMDMP